VITFVSLSLGAGAPSTALVIAIVKGLTRETRPGHVFDFGTIRPDLVQFADTGDELDATRWTHIPKFSSWLAQHGVALEIVRPSHGLSLSEVWLQRMQGLRASAPAVPLHLLNPRGDNAKGQARQQCTSEFKSRILDANAKRRARARGIRTGVHVLMGYTIEEWKRMRTPERYVEWGWTRGYPLIDAGANRGWCERVCLEHLGYVPEPSACVHCAHRPTLGPGSREWIKENEPQSWRKVVEFDAAMRHPPGIDADAAFVAEELLPVEDALALARKQGTLWQDGGRGCQVADGCVT